MVSNRTTVKQLRILRIKETLDLRGLPRSTFYEHINQGLMTPPVSLGARSVGWPESEVYEINRALISGANTEKIKCLVTELIEQRQQLKCA